MNTIKAQYLLYVLYDTVNLFILLYILYLLYVLSDIINLIILN